MKTIVEHPVVHPQLSAPESGALAPVAPPADAANGSSRLDIDKQDDFELVALALALAL